ncbi:MAG TPA: chromosome segregation protein SMC [bacterium]|nr:chromosome segregation protein SMC [bacterium]
MYLKRLELHGFKTFADRTEIEFTPGITAIVGPNGSGKSNVFDAIRWALGEMAFRSLRSGRLDDFIFGGSASRRSMGMAEVALTINNDSGVLPLDYAEITVTRRAQRGGEGEYLLNNAVSRLRDIQMLFLGTGLGGRSYSLIGQGQVDAVLNAGPVERRAWLEEAAGLARFKRRRREAERRLQHAAANLQRVADVLAELRAQREQLREQAAAAELHRSYTTEVRHLELGLQVDEARRVVGNLKRISVQTESTQQRLQTLATAGSEVGRQIDEARARAAQAAHDWEQGQRTLLQAVEDLGTKESTLQILQERTRSNAAQRERVMADVEQLEARLRQVEAESVVLREQAETMRVRRDELLERLRLAEETHESLQSVHQTLEDELAAGRRQAADLTAARTRATHDRARLEAKMAALDDQADALRARDAELTAVAAALGTQVLTAEANVAALRLEREEAARRRAAAAAEADALVARQAAIEDALRQLSAEEQVAASTLSLLEEMQRQWMGYEQGVREILLAKEEHPERFAGIRYPVAELLQVAPAHRPAIEAALGRRLFSLIAGTVDDVKQSVAYLRGNGNGDATFLPTELLSLQRPADPPPSSAVVGRASDLVQSRNGTPEVIDALLGDVMVIASLDAAVELRRQGFRGRMVTLDGELLSADGVISVRGRGDESAATLGRTERIDALRAACSDLAARRHASTVERETVTAALAQAQQRLGDADLNRQQAAADYGTCQAALSAARADAARAAGDQRELAGAADRLAAERDELLAEIARSGADQDDVTKALAEQEQALAIGELDLRSTAGRIQDASAALTEARVQLAELSGVLEGVAARSDEYTRQLAELTARRNQLQGEVAVLDGEYHLLDHSLSEVRQAHQALKELQEATREQLAVLDADRTGVQERLMELEGQWRQTQDALRDIEEQAHRLEVRQAQVETELTAAQRRIVEEFGVDWDAVRDARLPGSRDEALGRIQALRGLIAALGAVNLRALEEHELVAGRVDALEAQAGDLERARTVLDALMQRLDGVLRVRFEETFAAVNDEFNRLFTRLFGGGRAQLELVDVESGPSTPAAASAEPGIEITAQLPGKKTRALSALSGGERVLVALSLIFAMLRVHPSPFAIFDEVEAALDDTNTRKFTTLLRELAGQTQIIIITHNKGTMESADVLYGVTMETPGVSKIISMRLAPGPGAVREPALT